MDDLARALDELAGFLAHHGERRWAAWVARDAALVRSGDIGGVNHFLAAFGGMGSLADLVFDPSNGNAADEADAVALNAGFGHLRGRAWRIASDLRTDPEPGPRNAADTPPYP